jgi:MFS family permease
MTTISSIGMAIGALGSGPLTRFGKKNCIHMTNVLVIIACGLQQIQVYGAVLAGRFLFGLCGGGFSVFVPSFINEVTPIELKGPFGSSTQIFITLGIMISNLLGIPLPVLKYASEDTFIDQQYWRMLFGLPIAFSLIQSGLLLTVFNYETPKFLKQNGRTAELNNIMGKIYSHDQV